MLADLESGALEQGFYAIENTGILNKIQQYLGGSGPVYTTIFVVGGIGNCSADWFLYWFYRAHTPSHLDCVDRVFDCPLFLNDQRTRCIAQVSIALRTNYDLVDCPWSHFLLEENLGSTAQSKRQDLNQTGTEKSTEFWLAQICENRTYCPERMSKYTNIAADTANAYDCLADLISRPLGAIAYDAPTENGTILSLLIFGRFGRSNFRTGGSAVFITLFDIVTPLMTLVALIEAGFGAISRFYT